MKRIFITLMLLSSTQLYAAPYDTAVRFSEGDVISAEVLNDILDRIELVLKAIEASDLVGTWNTTQTTCNLDGPETCWNFDSTGFGGSQDELIRQRYDF